MFDHPVQMKTGGVSPGFSWPSSRYRWCTGKLKVDIINKYFSNLRKQYSVVRCVGIAADEGHRLERKNADLDGMRYPLVEWGWTEKDALQYCYDRGYDWEGLYELFSRVSCWCCPLQPLSELRTLRDHFPELWRELKDMDRRTRRKFRADYTVDELEVRFDLEKEFTAQGKSIRNKEFFNELKKRLS
jgi:3'-phosphoadenosine 5'-phosphosulfate sulfotransferase (PAPS reductase)/FAD synthetase